MLSKNKTKTAFREIGGFFVSFFATNSRIIVDANPRIGGKILIWS